MRGLTKKQKKILTDWANKNKDKIGLSFDAEDDIFPYELYELLKSINDFETLNQEINYFVQEIATS